MDAASRPAPPGEENFDRSCAYCGARFRVRITHGPFADQAEEYACPECGKRYETGAAHDQRIEGMLATCLQHEMDHLEGILFIDHLSRLKREMVLKKLEKSRRARKAA